LREEGEDDEDWREREREREREERILEAMQVRKGQQLPRSCWRKGHGTPTGRGVKRGKGLQEDRREWANDAPSCHLFVSVWAGEILFQSIIQPFIIGRINEYHSLK